MRILISGAGTNGNIIAGNLIGVTAAGTAIDPIGTTTAAS